MYIVCVRVYRWVFINLPLLPTLYRVCFICVLFVFICMFYFICVMVLMTYVWDLSAP